MRDVGTGSGCIALSLARKGAYELVTAVDRSAEALGLARENRDRLGPGRAGPGDLCGPLGSGSSTR